MSYNFVNKDEGFLEGIHVIQAKYPYYDRDKLEDTFSQSVYSIEMVKKSLIFDELFNQFLQILIFDALIGNSDRHHSNWGLITNMSTNKTVISPLYDNGSSLCAYDEEENIEIILKDKLRFNALIDSKSKTTIGFNNRKNVRHFELVEYISRKYYYQTLKIVNKILSNITSESIDNTLQKFESNIMSDSRKKLVKKFILERRKKILNIYSLGEEE